MEEIDTSKPIEETNEITNDINNLNIKEKKVEENNNLDNYIICPIY